MSQPCRVLRLSLSLFLLVLGSTLTTGQVQASEYLVGAASTPAPTTLHLYQTESAAQAHCPSDTVVWLNTKSGIYHLKGERWYGNTKQGAYVCKKEADATPGDRETRNGQ